MPVRRIAFASAIAYALYRYVTAKQKANGSPRHAAFADGEATPGEVQVRNAGPEAMASPTRTWDKIDEASDESYPSSDAPSSDRFT